MSEFSAKSLRDKMRSKISRLVRTDPKAKVDASGYTPPDALDADVKTGARPLSRRLYKRGGKVIMVSGESEKKHAGRKARKSGGKALTADSYVNRNVREANEERDGIKHVGGFKRGGKTMHEDVAEDKKLIKSMVKKDAIKPGKAHGGSCRCSKCMGGRAGKAGGGYADGGKTKWIQKAIKHPGSLHKALHVAEGEKIPEKKLAKATHSKNPHIARKARLAETLKGFHKADGGATGGTQQTIRGPIVRTTPRIVKYSTAPMPKSGPTEGDLNDLRAAKEIAQQRGMKFRKRGGKASVSDGSLEGTRPTGGRLARKSGGRAKGKMNVNIIIGTGPRAAEAAPAAAAAPVGVPVGLRQNMPPMGAPAPAPAGGMPSAAGAPAGMPPGMMPPGAGPMMGRKSGGRVSYPIKDGAGGGLGRLQKIEAYGDEAYDGES